MENRRLKRIAVSNEQVLSLFSYPKYLEDGNIICINNYYLEGLPEDVEPVAVTYSLEYANWYMFVTSKEFEEVPIGNIIPVIEWSNNVIVKKEKYQKVESYAPLF